MIIYRIRLQGADLMNVFVFMLIFNDQIETDNSEKRFSCMSILSWLLAIAVRTQLITALTDATYIRCMRRKGGGV